MDVIEEYLRQKLRDDVEAILDDPNYPIDDLIEWIEQLHAVGNAVGTIDVQEMFATLGTEYERNRLRTLLLTK